MFKLFWKIKTRSLGCGGNLRRDLRPGIDRFALRIEKPIRRKPAQKCCQCPGVYSQFYITKAPRRRLPSWITVHYSDKELISEPLLRSSFDRENGVTVARKGPIASLAAVPTMAGRCIEGDSRSFLAAVKYCRSEANTFEVVADVLAKAVKKRPKVAAVGVRAANRLPGKALKRRFTLLIWTNHRRR
jgi:hypothetical protein